MIASLSMTSNNHGGWIRSQEILMDAFHAAERRQKETELQGTTLAVQSASYKNTEVEDLVWDYQSHYYKFNLTKHLQTLADVYWKYHLPVPLIRYHAVPLFFSYIHCFLVTFLFVLFKFLLNRRGFLSAIEQKMTIHGYVTSYTGNINHIGHRYYQTALQKVPNISVDCRCRSV